MNSKRIHINDYFMEMAFLVSKRSTCIRREVGCVLVNERNHVIATGYNGSARGLPNCNDVGCQCPDRESGKGLDQCVAVHAEENAIIQCKDVFDIYSCYTTTFPCQRCLRMLLNTGCMKIFYSLEYSAINEGIKLWKSSNPFREAYKILLDGRFEV